MQCFVLWQDTCLQQAVIGIQRHAHYDCVPLPESTDILSWPSLPQSMICFCVVHITLSMTNWITERGVQAGCQWTFQMIIWDFFMCIWHIMPIMDSSFCSTLLQGMTHLLIMWHSTSISSLPWKQPSSPAAKEFKAIPYIRKLKRMYFVNIKVYFLWIYLRWHCNCWPLLWYCGRPFVVKHIQCCCMTQ